MPVRPQAEDPPPERMVRHLNQPDHTAGFFTELVDRIGTRFQASSPIRRGTPYSATTGANQKVVDQFGNRLRFLKEDVPLAGTIRGMAGDKFVIWIWGTDHLSDDCSNAAVEYLSESTAHPVYTRPVTVLREVYEANPTGTVGAPLTALIGIKVTVAGTGYTKDDAVVIGGSHGGVAQLVVDENGAITNVIVTNQGSGYDSASLPAVTVTSATGSGATLAAIVQPKTAVLVSQKKVELSDNDPYSNEFVQVIRIYKTIPGPPLTRKSVGVPILVPPEFRRQVQMTDTKQVVAPDTDLPTLSGTQSSAVIEQTTTAEAEKTVTDLVVDVDADPLEGQEYDQEYDVVIPYTKGLEPSGTSLGDNRKDITPVGDGTDVVRTFDPDAIEAVFASYVLPMPTTVNLDLPDVLISLKALTSTAVADGSYTETGSKSGTGTTYFYSTTPEGTAQASASIVPGLLVEIKRYRGRHIPAVAYFFLMKIPFTAADVLAKLAVLVGASINAWPKFIEEAHSVILKGMKVSGEMRGRRHYQESHSSDGSSLATTAGIGHSVDVSSNIDSTHIPPTIHGSITIDVSGFTASIMANAAINLFAGDVDQDIDLTATASVTPASFSATSPSGLPSSGKCSLPSGPPSPYRFGWAKVMAEVFDWSNVV